MSSATSLNSSTNLRRLLIIIFLLKMAYAVRIELTHKDLTLSVVLTLSYYRNNRINDLL